VATGTRGSRPANARRVTTEVVITAAEAVVDRAGWDALTMTALAAEVGVQTPSLYNHVDGLDDVRRRLGLLGIRDLAETVRAATMGRADDDALIAMAGAFRDYVHRHPGRYLAQSDLARGDDADYVAEAARAAEAALAVLAGYGLAGDDAERALHGMWATIHGFVMLEITGGLSGVRDRDGIFERLVATFARAFGSTDTRLPTWGGHRPARRRRTA
jgi:AcrR family transcriptional regulator